MKRNAYALIGCIAIGAIVLFGIRRYQQLPSYESAKAAYHPSDIKLLDRSGQVLHELRVDPTVRRLTWKSLEEIPEYFQKLLIQAEDRRFFRHHGVDMLAMGGAIIHFRSQKRGASTITMQLAGMLDPTLKSKSKGRSFSQKINQMIDAWMLETKWNKKEIFEAYMNFSYYRGELQGIEAAAQGLFQKYSDGLTIEEAAILSALIQQPNGEVKNILKRACNIATNIQLSETCDSIELLSENLATKNHLIEKENTWAPHVARMLIKKNDHQDVQTTLEKNLQVFATQSIQKQMSLLQGKNVTDGAALVLENQTGNVLAYVGNSGDPKSFYVDGVKAHRQAGSTLKPFLYASAFENKILTPSSILDDSPLEIAVSGGMYRPKNYDEHFHGKVSVSVALGSSMNVPAVKTLQLVGVENFVERLKDLGFSTLEDSTFYGPSLALGTADVSLWELTNAYRVLANGGMYTSPLLVSSSENVQGTTVFSEKATFLVGNILSNANNRSLAFGLGSPLSGKSWFAVKTGTSKDMRDNWCVGYSDKYTVGVWVGNFSGESMWNVSGVSGAAPIFSDIIHFLHQDQPSIAPIPPEGVIEGPKDKWFMAGTESKKEFKLSSAQLPEITYPSDETIIAWDPDISKESQKVTFEAKAYDRKWSWKLNGHLLGKASGPVRWTPSKNGEFILALEDQSKKVLDQIHFEVRGLPRQK